MASGLLAATLGQTPAQPTKGTTYVDPATGRIMNWQSASYTPYTGAGVGGQPIPGQYNDTGQYDASYQKNRALNTVLSSVAALNGVGAGGSASGTVSGGGGGAVGPTSISLPSSQAADAAAMTRAKEESGQALAGAAKTLRGVYNSRGLTGSGQEAVGESKLVADAARTQTATGADLLRQSLDRSSNVASENAQLQEGYANRQTNYNISQQQIALQAKVAAQNQLTDLLRTVGALV